MQRRPSCLTERLEGQRQKEVMIRHQHYRLVLRRAEADLGCPDHAQRILSCLQHQGLTIPVPSAQPDDWYIAHLADSHPIALCRLSSANQILSKLGLTFQPGDLTVDVLQSLLIAQLHAKAIQPDRIGGIVAQRPALPRDTLPVFTLPTPGTRNRQAGQCQQQGPIAQGPGPEHRAAMIGHQVWSPLGRHFSQPITLICQKAVEPCLDLVWGEARCHLDLGRPPAPEAKGRHCPGTLAHSSPGQLNPIHSADKEAQSGQRQQQTESKRMKDVKKAQDSNQAVALPQPSGLYGQPGLGIIRCLRRDLGDERAQGQDQGKQPKQS